MTAQVTLWACPLCGAVVETGRGGRHFPSCFHSPEGIERERAEERALGHSGNLYRASEPVTAEEAWSQGIRQGKTER